MIVIKIKLTFIKKNYCSKLNFNYIYININLSFSYKIRIFPKIRLKYNKNNLNSD